MAGEEDISEDQKKVVDAMLLEAVESVNYERIDLCLAKGADIDTRNANGRTPLMMAVWKDDAELVAYVLGKNPALFLKDSGGKSAFDLLPEVRDASVRDEIGTLLLQALPDHVRRKVSDPAEIAEAVRNMPEPPENYAEAGIDVSTQHDVSLSKPVALGGKKKKPPGGLRL
jgi:ankyrin repeat protein